jgi:hypothetical protein
LKTTPSASHSAYRTRIVCAYGSATGARPAGTRPAAPQHEPALGEPSEGVLEGGEVPADERIDRPALRAGGAHPPAEHLRSGLGLHLSLVDERQQDPEFRAMVELTGEQRQRIDAQRRAELILSEPQQLLEAGRARALTGVAFGVDRRIVATQPTRSIPTQLTRSISTQPTR